MFPFEVRSRPQIFFPYFSFGFCHFPVGIMAVIPCFNLQNGFNMNESYDYQDCIGLRVKPRKGDGLLFYSLFPNGTIDAVSLISLLHHFSICFLMFVFAIRSKIPV